MPGSGGWAGRALRVARGQRWAGDAGVLQTGSSRAEEFVVG